MNRPLVFRVKFHILPYEKQVAHTGLRDYQ